MTFRLRTKATLMGVALCAALVIPAGAAIVQIEKDYVAFQAEFGSLDDDPTNGSKFDVMAPETNSFGDVLVSNTSGGEVSFEVRFAETVVYTVFFRYRETAGAPNPSLELLLDGNMVSATTLYTNSSDSFEWIHGGGMDVFPTAGTTHTLTIRNATSLDSPGMDSVIDAVAIVQGSAWNGGGFAVNDSTITLFSIPEPSSSALLLLGTLLLARRNRRL